jgi:bifunctional non-homologous end joining protein LigD
VGKQRLGIVVSEHADEDGAIILRRACKLGLEGIVSKRLSAPYRWPFTGLDKGEEPG